MSEAHDNTEDLPGAQYVAAERVLEVIARDGARRVLSLSVLQTLTLGALGGAFVTAGALFSVLLATGVDTPGAERLLEGLGFSAGFFFVILSGAALFTEANVAMPATLFGCSAAQLVPRVIRFWALTWVGNFIGALAVGWAIHLSQHYPSDVGALLSEIVDRKMSYRATGGPGAWWQVVLSGVLANWLVGMAAFFAVMGRTIIGKFVPVFLAVSLFVAANLQHSPANMGFFSLIMPSGEGPGWGSAFAWNLIPAGLGNITGAFFLVVLPFWYALRPAQREAVGERTRLP